MRKLLMAAVGAFALTAAAGHSHADMAAAEKWVDDEFRNCRKISSAFWFL